MLFPSVVIAAVRDSETPSASSCSPINAVRLFLATVKLCSIVAVAFENLVSISSAADAKDSTTIRAVICPSAAISLSSPFVTFRYLATALSISGACSATELNSSPRNVPEAKPWLNWTIAAFAAAASVPLSAKD